MKCDRRVRKASGDEDSCMKALRRRSHGTQATLRRYSFSTSVREAFLYRYHLNRVLKCKIPIMIYSTMFCIVPSIPFFLHHSLSLSLSCSLAFNFFSTLSLLSYEITCTYFYIFQLQCFHIWPASHLAIWKHCCSVSSPGHQ